MKLNEASKRWVRDVVELVAEKRGLTLVKLCVTEGYALVDGDGKAVAGNLKHGGLKLIEAADAVGINVTYDAEGHATVVTPARLG